MFRRKSRRQLIRLVLNDAFNRVFDLTNLNVVSDLTRAVLQQQEAAFWTSEWDA